MYQRAWYDILWGVTETRETLAEAYSEALVREIKAEMGRRDIHSVNALAGLMGINRAKLNERLNRSRSGKRVELKSSDLYSIAEALEIEPAELVRRAYAASRPSPTPPADSPARSA